MMMMLMKKTKTINFLLMVLLVAACSVEISDATPTHSPASVAASAVGTVAATSPATPANSPAWIDYDLTGQLIFTQGAKGIEKFDLATGERQTIFKPLENAWLTAATVAPDGKRIVMSYAPSPPPGQIQLGYTGLYIIPADGSAEPLPLLERADVQESFFTPIWSPDGKYLYYAHFIPIRGDSGTNFKYTVERMVFPDGQPEVLVENGIWPRLSPDGSKLAYLSFDPQTFANDLYIADPDGKDAKSVIPSGTFAAVDAHVFSPDGSMILFSAVGEGPANSLSWIDRLLGVQIAEASANAHNVPSDWWRISLNGGKPERLTKIYDTGMYASFSPGGKAVIFLAASGMYVMYPDGSGLLHMFNADGLGTVEWIP